MLCWFLSCNSMNQHKCPYVSSLLNPSPIPHPTPLGCHRAPGGAPCVIQQLPSSYVLYFPWFHKHAFNIWYFFLSDLLHSECIIDNLQNPDLSVIMVSHVTPYKIKKKCLLTNCIVDAARILPFLVEHVFLPMGEVWLLHKCRCTMQSERSVLSHFSHVRLSDPANHSPPGSPVPGVPQARTLEWVAMPSSRGPSWPRVWTWVSRVSCIAGGFFTHWATSRERGSQRERGIF